MGCTCFFFFSSRRRHTRSLCDWSSDVCSSDLRCRSLCARAETEIRRYRDREQDADDHDDEDRKSTRLNSSHTVISYAVFCLKNNSLSLNIFELWQLQGT